MENILDKYEFTDDMGNPITDGLMDILKEPSREFAFTHIDSDIEPDKCFDTIQEILEQTEQTEGLIMAMQEYTYEYDEPPFYAIRYGKVIDISNTELMWNIAEVYFKLKQ